MSIDQYTPKRDEWPAGLLDALRQWEQGDVVKSPPLFYYADPAAAVWAATTDSPGTTGVGVIVAGQKYAAPYGIITTQTCDIAEEDGDPVRPWVHVSPVFKSTWKAEKLKRGGPRYLVLVPDLERGKTHVADLRIEMPIEKSWLLTRTPLSGFADSADKLAVGRRIAWLKSRPALSSALSAINNSLTSRLRPSGDREPFEGYLLLEEIAVRVDNFLAPTREQVVVIADGQLPTAGVEWFERWHDVAAESARNDNITLHPLRFEDINRMSVASYRGVAPIWSRSA